MVTRLEVGVFSPSVLLRVARRSGRLASRDLEIEEVPVSSSPAQFHALLDGDLDAVLTSPDNVVAYRFCPDNPLGVVADVRIVSAIDRGLGLGLYGRPGRSAADHLKGATLAVDVPTSGFAFAMYGLAESIGLTRADYRLVTLGSTPNRLDALLAGRCDATMLNAGNELRAEQAGCTAIARVADAGSPYLGTVLAVVGERRLGAAWRLAAALRETAADICAGVIDDVTTEEAGESLKITPGLAQRYLARLRDPDEGLVVDGEVDLPSLTTVVDLRRRYLPCVEGGVDLLAAALLPASGLVAAHPRHG